MITILNDSIRLPWITQYFFCENPMLFPQFITANTITSICFGKGRFEITFLLDSTQFLSPTVLSFSRCILLFVGTLQLSSGNMEEEITSINLRKIIS